MFFVEFSNVQAIGSGRLIWDDKTIIAFIGDNSNGKSVLAKVIKAMTSGDLADKEVRESLIKDGTDCASFLIQHDTKQLALIIKREARESCVIYVPDTNKKNENIIRAITDGGWQELVYEFGFRTYAKGNICLQLRETFGDIPLITTSGSVNDEILKDISSDRFAEQFINNYETITFPLFKARLKQKQQEKDAVLACISGLHAYDFILYDSLYRRMKEVYDAIKDYTYFVLSDIPIPPDVDIIPINVFKLAEIPIPYTAPIFEGLNNITDAITEYNTIMDGQCPTCGKPFFK